MESTAHPITMESNVHPESFDASAAALHVAQRKMCWAAVEGDFTAAGAVLAAYPDILAGPLNTAEDGAIHLAVTSGKAAFVRYLLSEMSSYEELLRRDGQGETPLTHAALMGRSDIAQILVRSNREALLTRNGEDRYPIYVAAFHRRDKVVRLLVDEASEQDFDVDTWSEFFIVAADSKLYDAAYQILDKFGSDLRPLVKTVHPEFRTALHVLAPGPSSDSWSRLVARIWRAVITLEKAEIETLFGGVESPPLILEAMKAGNIEMVMTIVREFREMLYCVDSNGHGVFHFAVRYWEETSTLRRAATLLGKLALKQDSDGNNLLHHAAKIPYSLGSPVNDDLAPGLKLRSEFSRFEAIKNDLPVKCQKMKNGEGLTPAELFLREHKEMIALTRSWVKAIAEASLLVAIMIMPLMYGILYGSSDEKEQHKKKFAGLIIFTMVGFEVVSICMFRFWYMFFYNFSTADFHTRLPFLLGSTLIVNIYFMILNFVVAFYAVLILTPKLDGWAPSYMGITTVGMVISTSFPILKILRDIGRPRRWKP